MNFSDALYELKRGELLTRKEWNDVGQYIFLLSGIKIEPLPDIDLRENQIIPYIAIMTIDEKIVPWLPSQIDLLANDWEVNQKHGPDA